MSEDDAQKILRDSSKIKNGIIYKKIIEIYLNQLNEFDAPNYYFKNTLNEHTDKVSTLIQLHSGLIATGSYDTTIRIWDLEKLSCIKTIHDLGKVFALLEFEPNMLLS